MLLHSSASLASIPSIRTLTTSSEDTLGSFKSEKRNTGDVLAVSGLGLASMETGDL